MGMDNFTGHQQKIIKRYYENIDSITLQKLGETVTEIYLAEGKKLDRLWKNAEAHMKKLEVPASRIESILKTKNAAQLASLVQELQSKVGS
jgi:hypothetical protein